MGKEGKKYLVEDKISSPDPWSVRGGAKNYQSDLENISPEALRSKHRIAAGHVVAAEDVLGTYRGLYNKIIEKAKVAGDLNEHPELYDRAKHEMERALAKDRVHNNAEILRFYGKSLDEERDAVQRGDLLRAKRLAEERKNFYPTGEIIRSLDDYDDLSNSFGGKVDRKSDKNLDKEFSYGWSYVGKRDDKYYFIQVANGVREISEGFDEVEFLRDAGVWVVKKDGFFHFVSLPITLIGKDPFSFSAAFDEKPGAPQVVVPPGYVTEHGIIKHRLFRSGGEFSPHDLRFSVVVYQGSKYLYSFKSNSFWTERGLKNLKIENGKIFGGDDEEKPLTIKMSNDGFQYLEEISEK